MGVLWAMAKKTTCCWMLLLWRMNSFVLIENKFGLKAKLKWCMAKIVMYIKKMFPFMMNGITHHLSHLHSRVCINRDKQTETTFVFGCRSHVLFSMDGDLHQSVTNRSRGGWKKVVNNNNSYWIIPWPLLLHGGFFCFFLTTFPWIFFSSKSLCAIGTK